MKNALEIMGIFKKITSAEYTFLAFTDIYLF